MYTYDATLTVEGVKLTVRPGTVSIFPPGAETVYSFPKRSIHACAHFAFDSQEGESRDAVDVPLLQDVGPRFGELYQSMEEAISIFPTSPVQAEVRLWDILWRLARPQSHSAPTTNKTHPALRRALEIIELRLSDPLSVADLAAEVELSHNHLTRLFQAEQGCSVIGYIQTRRVQRAQHLLVNSQLPIKTIAAQVGVADPRLFNKLIHKSLGASPQQVRRVAASKQA
jgi:AraC family transcriptional regulator